MLAARGMTNLDGSAFVRYLYQINVASGSGCVTREAGCDFLARASTHSDSHTIPHPPAINPTPPASPPRSEYALHVLLSFGANAREPMGPRLIRAAAPGGAFAVPVTFLYGGARDWMPVGAGDAVAARLRLFGVDAACLRTPHAGHHLYAENPEVFAEQLLGRLAEARARGNATRVEAARSRAAVRDALRPRILE